MLYRLAALGLMLLAYGCGGNTVPEQLDPREEAVLRFITEYLELREREPDAQYLGTIASQPWKDGELLLFYIADPENVTRRMTGITYAYVTPDEEGWKAEFVMSPGGEGHVSLADCNWRQMGSTSSSPDPNSALSVAIASMQNRPEDLTMVNGQVCDIPGATQVRLVWPFPFEDIFQIEQLSEDGRFLSFREWFVRADHIEVLDADGKIIGLSESSQKRFERVP